MLKGAIFSSAVQILRHPRVGMYLCISLIHWGPRARMIEFALDEIIRAAPSRDTLRVVDVGCGPGHLSRLAEDRNLTYFGIDTDTSMIDYCKARYESPHATFVCGDPLRMEDFLSSCDIVVMNGLLHHVPDSVAYALINQARSAHALIVAEHFRDPARMRPLVRFMQNLDRGCYVRDYSFFDKGVGCRPAVSGRCDIRVLGITFWTYFSNLYYLRDKGELCDSA